MWALSQWFFKDVGFKFEKDVCNGCHDLLTMACSLKNIAQDFLPITGLIGKKSCKKQKKNIRKKKLLSIMHKTKKLLKKSQESIIKTCHKKKRQD